MNERKLRKTLLKSIPLETERLTIRYIQTDDAYDMYEYASKPEVCEFLLWEPHINLAATEGYIESLKQRYKKGFYADWALILKSNGKMIGTCGFANFNSAERICEIGYVLSPYYRKYGYMTEAVEAVLKLSFETLDVHSATLRIIEQNEDSIRLAKRLGFELYERSQMEIKGNKRTIAHYSLSSENYFNRK